MRFGVRADEDGLFGVWDAACSGWRARGLDRDAAQRAATELDVQYDQYGPRPVGQRRKVNPPVEVERVGWAPAGRIDYWVKNQGVWYGRLIDNEGGAKWVPSSDLRPQHGPSRDT